MSLESGLTKFRSIRGFFFFNIACICVSYIIWDEKDFNHKILAIELYKNQIACLLNPANVTEYLK